MRAGIERTELSSGPCLQQGGTVGQPDRHCACPLHARQCGVGRARIERSSVEQRARIGRVRLSALSTHLPREDVTAFGQRGQAGCVDAVVLGAHHVQRQRDVQLAAGGCRQFGHALRERGQSALGLCRPAQSAQCLCAQHDAGALVTPHLAMAACQGRRAVGLFQRCAGLAKGQQRPGMIELVRHARGSHTARDRLACLERRLRGRSRAAETVVGKLCLGHVLPGVHGLGMVLAQRGPADTQHVLGLVSCLCRFAQPKVDASHARQRVAAVKHIGPEAAHGAGQSQFGKGQCCCVVASLGVPG